VARADRGGFWRPLAAVAVTALVFATLVTARGGDARLYPPTPGETVTLYLVDNGFHTDIALPRASLAPLAARAAAQVTDRPWVMAGWGDARFFIEEGMSVDRALDGLRSLFAPNNASAVRLDGLPVSPDRYYASGVRRVRVSSAGLARLAARLDTALERDGAGRPVLLPGRGEPHVGFFRSGERFSLLHLCNHWTAELLNAAGLPVTPVLDTLPVGLILDLKLRARVDRAPGGA
jgi:uncharacterized protein (TIGR02117 family)